MTRTGAIAQLGEHLPCTQGVCGSIPHSSTIFNMNAAKRIQRKNETTHIRKTDYK